MYPRDVTQREKAAAAWPLTLIVHVGPHKTATTSIQAALAHNSPYLASRGVHVPAGAHPDFGGHHIVPFVLAGKSLVPLGISGSAPAVSGLLDAWLVGARDTSARRILVSSEVFDELGENEWLTLDRELREAATRTGTRIEGLIIHFTDRELEARLKSSAGNSILHGATLPMDELVEWLRADMATRDALIDGLPSLLPGPIEVSHIDFAPTHSVVTGAPEKDFVGRWFDHVLGLEDAAGIEPAAGFEHLNPSLSAETLEEVRLFNVANNPPGAPGVRAYSRFDGNPALEQAFARLNKVRFVFIERDRYRAEAQARMHEVESLRAEVVKLKDRSLRARIRRLLRG